MHDADALSVLIFLVTLVATFAVSFLGRAHARKLNSDALADQSLSKWLVGLSAGATGNSAFIVTGVVGFGLYAWCARFTPALWLALWRHRVLDFLPRQDQSPSAARHGPPRSPT